MNNGWRALAGLLIYVAAVACAQAMTLKRVKAHAVEFAANAVALPAPDRQGIAQYANSLREADWCPLEVVLVLAQSPASSSATEHAMAAARATYVANLLLLNGVPSEAVHAEAKQSPVQQPLVDIEALGAAWLHECPYPKNAYGFRVRAPARSIERMPP